VIFLCSICIAYLVSWARFPGRGDDVRGLSEAGTNDIGAALVVVHSLVYGKQKVKKI